MTIRQGQTVIAGLSSVTNAVDNSTITVNGSNKIQANGILNQNTSTVKYDWVGTLAQYNALNSYNDSWTYFITDDNVTTTTVQPVIGQIVQVVCAEDYIPDGCLPCDGTEYSRNTFSDLWTNYLTSDPVRLAVCSYADYSSAITTYGQCGKFAVDSVNGKFKTPYIKDGSYITQALSDSELGKSYNESLPNITSGEASVLAWKSDTSPYTYQTGALKRDYSTIGGGLSSATGLWLNSATAYFNAAYSSSTYQDNAKVQGDNVRARYFVVVVDGHINQSMMDWSQWTTEMNNKADLDLANTGRITNCITYIPQDIKLELSNGTLTLKSGSKVYVPNGSGVFDTMTIASDIIIDPTIYGTTQDNGFLFTDGSYWWIGLYEYVTSGTTAPSTSAARQFWYDTSANLIKMYAPNESTYTCVSFPIAIVSTVANTSITVDQVFNGFGYIGSTVFALPGVKGLIPNGRNSNGSLKNTEIILDTVIKTASNIGNNQRIILTGTTTGISYGVESKSYITDKTVDFVTSAYYFNTATNIAKKSISSSTSWDTSSDELIYGYCETGSGYITAFYPNTCFKSLDYNDKGTISGWGMPSNKYIDLTLGSSGATYTAPANGYVVFSKTVADTQYIALYNNTASGVGIVETSSGSQIPVIFLPVHSGDIFTANYSGTGATNRFRFVYADGEI